MTTPKLLFKRSSSISEMSPPRPPLSSFEFSNISEELAQESSMINSTKVYYAKQYNKYRAKKHQTKTLTLSLTYQGFVHWLKLRGIDNMSSHLTRKEFQVCCC